MVAQSANINQVVNKIAQYGQTKLENLSAEGRKAVFDFLTHIAVVDSTQIKQMQDRVVVILESTSQDEPGFIMWIIAYISNQIFIWRFGDVTTQEIDSKVDLVWEAEYQRECTDAGKKQFYLDFLALAPQEKYKAFIDTDLQYQLVQNNLKLEPNESLEQAKERYTAQLGVLTEQRDDSVRQRAALEEELASDPSMQEKARLDTKAHEFEVQIQIAQAQHTDIHKNLAQVGSALNNIQAESSLTDLKNKDHHGKANFVYLSNQKESLIKQLQIYEEYDRLMIELADLNNQINELSTGSRSFIQGTYKLTYLAKKKFATRSITKMTNSNPYLKETNRKTIEHDLREDLKNVEKNLLACSKAIIEVNDALKRTVQEQETAGTSTEKLKALGKKGLKDLELNLLDNMTNIRYNRISLERDLDRLIHKKEGLPCTKKQKELNILNAHKPKQDRQITNLQEVMGLFPRVYQLRGELEAMSPLFTWAKKEDSLKINGINMRQLNILASAIKTPMKQEQHSEHSDWKPQGVFLQR